MPRSTARSPQRRIATNRGHMYRYILSNDRNRISPQKRRKHTRFNRKHSIYFLPLNGPTKHNGRVQLHLNEGVLRRAGEPLTSGVPMQWLPRERSHPLLVRRKGLALLLPFRGIPQPYFALLVRGRETLSFATPTRKIKPTPGERNDKVAYGQRLRQTSQGPRAKIAIHYQGPLTSNDTARLTVWRPRSAKDVVAVSSTSEVRERGLNVPKPGKVRRRRVGRKSL